MSIKTAVRRWLGLDRLEEEGKAIMAKLDDVLKQIDEDTTKTGLKLEKLSAELAAAMADGSAPTAEQLAILDSVAARLKTIAADPANPVPAEVPTP